MPEIHSKAEVPIHLQVTHRGKKPLAENIAYAVQKQVAAMQFGTQWTILTVARQNLNAVQARLKELGVLKSDIQVLHANEDGSITIPEALRPYMGGQEKIE